MTGSAPALDVAGTRVDRVIHRPHEVRVYLRRAAGNALWLRFWPADDAHVERAGDGELTDAAVDRREDGLRVRLLAGDDVVLEARAPSWTWQPRDPEVDVPFWELAEDERQAVRATVDAVVGRDTKAVGPLLRDDLSLDLLWGEVDTYAAGEPVAIAAPPGPLEDWETECARLPGGVTEVGVQVFAADGPAEPTDLTLLLELRGGDDGSPDVTIGSLHVM